MGYISTISAYKPTIEKLGAISFTTQKTNAEIIRMLVNELENILKITIENEVKKGNIELFFTLMTNRVGNTLQLAFVPKARVKTKKSKPIIARYSKEGKFRGIVE